MTELMSAPAVVYRMMGDWGAAARYLCQRAHSLEGGVCRVFRRGKNEEMPAAVSFDRVTQLNRPGICQANDRCGMKAHADPQARGEMLVGRFGGDDRREVSGLGSCREARLLDEVFLKFRRIDTFAVCIGGVFRRGAEHLGELSIKVDQFRRNPFRRSSE